MSELQRDSSDKKLHRSSSFLNHTSGEISAVEQKTTPRALDFSALMVANTSDSSDDSERSEKSEPINGDDSNSAMPNHSPPRVDLPTSQRITDSDASKASNIGETRFDGFEKNQKVNISCESGQPRGGGWNRFPPEGQPSQDYQWQDSSQSNLFDYGSKNRRSRQPRYQYTLWSDDSARYRYHGDSGKGFYGDNWNVSQRRTKFRGRRSNPRGGRRNSSWSRGRRSSRGANGGSMRRRGRGSNLNYFPRFFRRGQRVNRGGEEGRGRGRGEVNNRCWFHGGGKVSSYNAVSEAESAPLSTEKCPKSNNSSNDEVKSFGGSACSPSSSSPSSSPVNTSIISSSPTAPISSNSSKTTPLSSPNSKGC